MAAKAKLVILITMAVTTWLFAVERPAESASAPIDPPAGLGGPLDCYIQAGRCQSQCRVTYDTCFHQCPPGVSPEAIHCGEACGNELRRCNDACVKPCVPHDGG